MTVFAIITVAGLIALESKIYENELASRMTWVAAASWAITAMVSFFAK